LVDQVLDLLKGRRLAGAIAGGDQLICGVDESRRAG
jgi:hypothetical protein